MSYMDNFYDQIEAQAAASESVGVRSNFGKLTIKPGRYVHWQGKYPNSVAVEVTAEQFAKLPAKETRLEVVFNVNIKEFNPDLAWEYERKVQIGDMDWRKTVLPSISEALGKKISKGGYAQAFQEIDGKYVEAQDVPQLDKEGNERTYTGQDGAVHVANTIKIARIFANRDECFKAWSEKFGGSGAPAPQTGSDVPEAYGDMATWQSVWGDIKSALASGKTVPQVAAEYGVQVKHIVQVQNS